MPASGRGRGTLEEYRARRDFSKTREPAGRAPALAARGRLRYVIQRHAARRLHYDFRLELDGVFRSWAVPKGPSLDPTERRLAVHVEDHPLEYGLFEGEIPPGEYGAGTVLLWDRGTWVPEGDPRDGYRRGRLKFRLEGEKLRGGWMLVRMGGRAAGEGKDNWLLIKEPDEAARPLAEGDILQERPESVGSRIRRRAAPPARAGPEARTDGPRRAAVAPLPEALTPPLATLVDRPPAGEEWLHEIKLDGYRLLARLEGRAVRLLTRRGHDWTARFSRLVRALRDLEVENAILDGEIVAFDPRGIPDFQALQTVLSSPDPDVAYYLFDLPFVNGIDLRRTPLVERKAALAALLRRASAPLRYSDHVEGHGEAFYREACALGVEGIVSKRRDSTYVAGRTREWVKVKCGARQEFVVGGYTDPEGTRTAFGALLLGVYEGDRLVYAGRVGTGFDEATLVRLHRRLRSLETDRAPFAVPPPREVVRRAHWVRPELVVEVTFAGWTRDGLVRHPSFEGLREDKPPREVVRERPAATPSDDAGGASETGAGAWADRPPAGSRGRARRTARSHRAEDTVIAGVRLTNPDRVLYPEQGITKRELAAYYERIADWILPHVVGRPISLVRCPEGRTGACFFQKHANLSTEGLRAIKVAMIAEDEGGEEPYLFIEDLAGLVSLVQLGALELHPWGARVGRLDHPDVMTIDLDPGPDVAWERVVATARDLHRRLDALGLRAFLKTTGGKGLHVVVPLAPRHGWADVKAFARGLAEELVAAAPDAYTTRAAHRARRGKILVDYLRNARGATAVAAYSTRARPGAPVSTPIRWDELTPALRSDAYTLENLPRRLRSLRRDPWEGYATADQTLTRAMRREVEGKAR